jgi:hypothetical protein
LENSSGTQREILERKIHCFDENDELLKSLKKVLNDFYGNFRETSEISWKIWKIFRQFSSEIQGTSLSSLSTFKGFRSEKEKC